MFSAILLAGSWGSFFGHFHPLFVHLPIGFLLIGILLEYLIIKKGKESLNEASTIIFFWGTVSAILSCIAGYYLKKSGGYEESTLNWHQYLGIGVALVSFLFYISKKWDIMQKLRAYMLFSIVGLLGVTGHLGGNMTHGSDYLTIGLPQPYKGWIVGKEKAKPIREKDPAKALVYNDVVEPIFEAKCFQCHNSEKQKGDLRMDTQDFLAKGGKHGPIFLANNAEGSELVKRSLLDLDDELHMPPKGKDQLTEQEIAILKWWIQNGASFTKKVSEIKEDDQIKPMFTAILGSSMQATSGKDVGGDQSVNPVYSLKVDKAKDSDIKMLESKSLVVEKLSNESNLLSISAVNYRGLNDNDMGIFSNISSQSAWIKLNDTQITDKSLQVLAKLPNLVRLDLSYTKISDGGVSYLSSSKNLEYLNLV
ncbi:MAG: c-type cytochrome domain-containing protein, partial [Leadbetterella sp.]